MPFTLTEATVLDDLNYEQLLPPLICTAKSGEKIGDKCLYDFYSSDSDEEVDFVELCLNNDEHLQYFQMPKSFTFKLQDHWQL